MSEIGFELSGAIGLVIAVTLFVATVAAVVGLPLLIFYVIMKGC